MAEHLETQAPVRVSRIDIDEARAAVEALGEINIPAELRDHLALFVRLERKVLREYDEDICNIFDKLLASVIAANEGNPGEEAAGDPTNEQGIPTTQSATADAFRDAIELIDSLSLDRAQIIVRAFTTFFHLANLSEENYRVETLRKRESRVSIDSAVDPVNELTVAYRQMIDEVGEDKANELLARLEFHPVFTAHPTEARRKAVEGKIRRISRLLAERPRLGGSDLMENERHLLQEIDALLRTSPVAPKKPTPVEEADTIIDIFDNTLFDTIPMVYRRFDDWILGDKAGTVPPVSLFPPFMLSPGDSPRPSVVVSVPLVSGWVVMLPLGVVSGWGEGFLLSASPQAASVTASISAAASAINRSVISVPPFPVLAPHAKNTLITRAVHS